MRAQSSLNLNESVLNWAFASILAIGIPALGLAVIFGTD